MKKEYLDPQADVLLIELEGQLCASGDTIGETDEGTQGGDNDFE